MSGQFQRLEMMFGKECLQRLSEATVLVLGIGGVGTFAIEALVRSGIGTLIIIDNDIIDITNLNRQLIALHKTVGQRKVDVMKERILAISPSCEVITYHLHYDCRKNDLLDNHKINFIIDCCDTVSSKLDIVSYAFHKQVGIISSMGTANKTDPTKFMIAKLEKTSYDPLARVLRREFKRRGMDSTKLDVVYSSEKPRKPLYGGDEHSKVRKKKFPPASNAYVPSVAGLICASHVINKIVEGKQ